MVKKVTFECEVITPMFIAGADRRKPELRPSEFKGMMRFWWRAAKAMDYRKLKEEEAKIFGGIGEKEGKSKILIRFFWKQEEKGNFKPIYYKNFKLQAYAPSSSFYATFMSNSNEIIELSKNLFLLAVTLGGFGKRSRRGFGSVRIIKVNDEEMNFPNLKLILEVLNKIKNKIENCYVIKKNKITNSKKINFAPYPWIKEIEIGKSSEDAESILKKINQASHKYKDPSLGNFHPRMASPVYVSIIKIDHNKYAPVVTTLNPYFPKKYPKGDLKKQNSFKEEILNG